jgi:hypothetical protein
MSEREDQQVRVRTKEEIDQAAQQLPWLQRTAWNLTPQPVRRLVTGQQAPAIGPPSEDARGFQRDAPGIYAGLTNLPRQGLNVLSGAVDYIMGRDPSSRLGDQVFGSPRLLPGRSTPPAKQRAMGPAGRTFQPEIDPGPSFEDFMAGVGGFDASPYQFDSTPYDEYLSFLQTQDAETQARIQAMYAQLAESADANVERVRDIYSSGTANLGDIYGSAYGGVEGAYSSAQEQAADQMARLGIEAAAPAVLDPMASAQAAALAGIEGQRAGGMGAMERYGTSAQEFGSQMSQVGQQQGLEVTAQIMRDAERRQAEGAFMREQARAEASRAEQVARANFNPYARAMERMQAEQMFNQAQGGQDPMALVEEMRIAQDRALSLQDRYIKLVQYYNDLDVRTRGKVNTSPGETPEERARMMLDLAGSEDFYPMPMF